MVLISGYNSCIRLIARNKVLFPHPEGPMIAVIFFSAISALTSSTAFFPGVYEMETFFSCNIGFVITILILDFGFVIYDFKILESLNQKS